MVINSYWLSISYQWLFRVTNGDQSVTNGYQWLPRVINGYQWLLVINKLSMFINVYQGLLMVICQLSVGVNSYHWLSVCYPWLSKVNNGYQ